MKMRAIFVTLLLAAWPAASLHAEGSRPWVAAYYPGLSWHLRYELEGVVEEYNNHKPGVSTYTVSKTRFVERDQVGFDALLASVRFDPAAESVERAFLIPGRGTLAMTVPTLWGFRIIPPGPAMRSVMFMDPAGDYQLRLALFPDADKVLKGDPTTRAAVEIMLGTMKAKVLERDPPLQPIKGRAARGCTSS